MSNAKQGPLPMVIGVTGHRDLRDHDQPALKNVVRLQIENIRQASPHTPLVVLSPLAEGADRLVAEVALEMGARLVVPLPMPCALYEQDFATVESREEFRRLLARAVNWFELPLVSGCTSEGISRAGRQRDLQYAQVGVFVARHSQIVMALWDGVDTGRIGGMSQVIRCRLQGGVPEELTGGHPLLDPEERGPVFHIFTPRIRNPDVRGGEPFSVRRLYPGKPEEQAGVRSVHETILSHIEQFNRDAGRQECQGCVSATAGKKGLPEEAGAEALMEGPPILDLYAKADILAITYRRQHGRRIAAIIVSAVAGAVALGFFDCYGGGQLWTRVEWRWIPILVFFLMGGATFAMWHITVRRDDLQSRYLDYRALAEGLRVQHFWFMAGISESVADHYLGKQAGEMGWIRHAIRTIAEVLGTRTGGEPGYRLPMDLPSRLSVVNNQWVREQALYYARNILPKERRERRFLSLAKALACAGILMVVPLLAVVTLNPNDLLEQTLLYECATCGLLAGALTAYVKVMAFGAEALQYQRAARVFERGNKLIESALIKADTHEARRLLTEIGNEALAENGDWVLTHRARPLDVPGLG